MRELFKIDLKDYKENFQVYKRPSARAIIIKDHKVALVYSKKYDYYKFPGGGINSGESIIDALIREVKEESGLIVIKESIMEYGMVKRIHKIDDNKIFYQENFYFLCEVLENIEAQCLDDYEDEEGFTLMFVEPNIAIEKNLSSNHPIIRKVMLERDAKVLKLLMEEGVI